MYYIRQGTLALVELTEMRNPERALSCCALPTASKGNYWTVHFQQMTHDFADTRKQERVYQPPQNGATKSAHRIGEVHSYLLATETPNRTRVGCQSQPCLLDVVILGLRALALSVDST
jgi:hypothetical protein